ncbi:TadE family protein [Brevundimonas sp. NPDC092305]|uniref:TadE family protein n=1 Tax=Brevundimonas sp. NPDC092305 TaxID=3363957 RepID=UPI003802AD1B
MSRFASHLKERHNSGAIAAEFALVGPLFVLLLMGLVVYGGWFWMAQGVSSLAAEGARAAVAGLDVAERDMLARAAVTDTVDATILSPDEIDVAVASTTRAIEVTVSYDASEHPFMALPALVPPPPRTITRTSTVLVGGY